MRFDILSLFPDYFKGPFDVSLIKRAKEKGLLEINLIDIRDFAEGKHRKVDDRPYGGGPGMVLLPGPSVKAIRSVKRNGSKVIYLSPQGRKLTAQKCKELSHEKQLILFCGHYEGVDERIIEKEIDEEISIGDYILMSGSCAAIVIIEAVARWIPGVLGNELSPFQESFEQEIFDAPHYTGPVEFEGLAVPEVLRSGHHQKIESWRKEKGLNKFRLTEK